MQRGIGGSDVAAIVGLSPYKTPADVYARIIEGVSSKSGTRARLGSIAEPHILSDYCERNSFPLDKFERNVELQRDDKPYMRGELDALFRGNHGVECKLVGFRQADRWGQDGSDHMPEEYVCQCAWYAMLAGVGRIEVAAWFDGGGDYRQFRYERSEALESTLIANVEKFWTDHVEKRVPPSLAGASPESIRAIFPVNNGQLRAATLDESELIAEFSHARDNRKLAEEREADLKGKLQAAIGDLDGIYGPDGKATWKQVRTNPKTDWESVAKACNPAPALIDQHTTTPAGFRRFLFTPKKG
jgi:putative phage-type endonuclease